MTSLQRQQHSVGKALFVAEDHVDFPLSQLTQQIGRQRNRGGLNQQYGYFTQMDPSDVVLRTDNQVVHFIVQLRETGNRNDTPAHISNRQYIDSLLVKARSRLMNQESRFVLAEYH